MTGRTIVTGASGSMGAAAVESLASKGVPVLMACRNLRKAEAVRADVLSRVPGADITLGELDLSSLDSVRRFTEGIAPGSVSALFNNAGTISREYSITADGFENTFAVNYFGPWLLTRLLLDKLPDDAHIVNMVSLTCRFVKVDERSLRPEREDFSQLGTYARAKRALLSFSLSLLRRHPALRVNLADPGIVASNMIDLGHWFDPLADALFKPFCKSPENGVQPALRALAADEVGLYFKGKGSEAIPARFIDPSLDGRLWDETAGLVSYI